MMSSIATDARQRSRVGAVTVDIRSPGVRFHTLPVFKLS